MLGVKLVDYEVDSFAKVDQQSMNEVDTPLTKPSATVLQAQEVFTAILQP